jgi:hypothetical protein
VRSIRFSVGLEACVWWCGRVGVCYASFSCFYPTNRAAISSCIYVIVSTILVVVVMEGGVSNCSTYRILFRRLSTLELSACSMSSTSTGAGEAGNVVSVWGGSSGCDPLSRYFLRDAMCGSLLALFAEPRTNTNFCSNSLAMA